MLVFFFTDVKAGGKVQFVVFQWEACNVAMFYLSPLICLWTGRIGKILHCLNYQQIKATPSFC